MPTKLNQLDKVEALITAPFQRVSPAGVTFWGRFGLERGEVIAEVRRRYAVEHGEDVAA